MWLGLEQEWGLTKMEAPVHSHFGPYASSKGKKGDTGRKQRVTNMPKMMGSVWAPRMGSPEGTLTPFPFLFWVPSRTQKENQELWSPSLAPHQPRMTLICSYTLLCRPQSPQLWNGLCQPDTFQVYESGQGVLLVVLCGNRREAPCFSPFGPCLALRRRWGLPGV